MLGFLEGGEGFADPIEVFRREFAVLFAKILAQRFEPLRGVDQLNVALAVLGLAIGQYPDVGRDAGVVEHIERQRDDGFEPVVLDDPAANVTFALSGLTCEERRSVVDFSNAAAERRLAVHLADHIGQKQ